MSTLVMCWLTSISIVAKYEDLLSPTSSASTLTPHIVTHLLSDKKGKLFFIHHSWFDSFGQVLIQRVDVFSFDRDLRPVLKLHLIRQTHRQRCAVTTAYPRLGGAGGGALMRATTGGTMWRFTRYMGMMCDVTNLAPYISPSVHRTWTMSPLAGGPSRTQSRFWET